MPVDSCGSSALIATGNQIGTYVAIAQSFGSLHLLRSLGTRSTIATQIIICVSAVDCVSPLVGGAVQVIKLLSRSCCMRTHHFWLFHVGKFKNLIVIGRLTVMSRAVTACPGANPPEKYQTQLAHLASWIVIYLRRFFDTKPTIDKIGWMRGKSHPTGSCSTSRPTGGWLGGPIAKPLHPHEERGRYANLFQHCQTFQSLGPMAESAEICSSSCRFSNETRWRWET